MNKQFIDGVLEVLREDGRQICKQAAHIIAELVEEIDGLQSSAPKTEGARGLNNVNRLARILQVQQRKNPKTPKSVVSQKQIKLPQKNDRRGAPNG